MVLTVDDRSYFYDKTDGNKVNKFDPNNSNIEFLYQAMEGYTIHVAHQNIFTGRPMGIYFKDINGDTVIINDKHQQELVYSGYIIRNNYDNIQQYDKEQGLMDRDLVCCMIKNALYKYKNIENASLIIDDIKLHTNNITAKFKLPDNLGTGVAEFKTISNIVNQNKFRGEYSLPYYPYLKHMDKYNVYHMNIFMNNDGTEFDKNHLDLFDNFTDSILEIMKAEVDQNPDKNEEKDRYTAKILPIKNTIIRWMSYDQIQ